MKNAFFKILSVAVIFFAAAGAANAAQFDVLVIPTEISSVCENYFCFPEPSEVAANYVINQLNETKNINVTKLSDVREKLFQNSALKSKTEDMLKTYEQTERIDYVTLKDLSEAFGVKYVILISCYAITDRAETRRNLWEVLEISSAFKITYPFSLTTTSVLVDTANSTVMWSGKFSKTVSDSNGYFLALNQAQAASHLEKIRQYFRSFVAPSISQNVHLRFFPREVRTFNVNGNQKLDDTEMPKFTPNALEHMLTPEQKAKVEGSDVNYLDSTEELIFDF